MSNEISSEIRILSSYAINRTLERIGNRLSEQNRNLALKIIDLFKNGDNQARVAEIHEKLFNHLSTSSANQALTRFINAFNQAAEQSG